MAHLVSVASLVGGTSGEEVFAILEGCGSTSQLSARPYHFHAHYCAGTIDIYLPKGQFVIAETRMRAMGCFVADVVEASDG
jgi:hypothetical protein